MFTFKGKLKATPNDIYSTLLEQMILDIEDKTQKKIKVSQLEKGFKYKYKKKNNYITVEILKTIPDKKITTIYNQGENRWELSYEIDAIDKEWTRLLYIQNDGLEEIKGFKSLLSNMELNKRFNKLETHIKSKLNNA